MTVSTTQANHAYSPGWVPAHECVRLAICYLCHRPCRVERLPPGHITVPWCGCGEAKMPDAEAEAAT